MYNRYDKVEINSNGDVSSCETSQWIFFAIVSISTFHIIALSKRSTRHVVPPSTLTDPAYFFATIYSRRDIACITTRKFLFVKISYLIFDSELCYIVGSADPQKREMIFKREKFNRQFVCRRICHMYFPRIKISLMIEIWINSHLDCALIFRCLFLYL